MASIAEITPGNIKVFYDFIPDVLKADVSNNNLHYYGVEESGEASGVIILRQINDTAEIKYIYILPYLRGTGLIDIALNSLFFNLKDEGYNYLSMRFLPKEYPMLNSIAKRFDFEVKSLDYAYFKFGKQDIMKSKASNFEPKNTIRMKYLPKNKKDSLMKLIKKNISLYGKDIITGKMYEEFSIAYMDGDTPKGALVVESPSPSNLPAVEGLKSYPEPGTYDITLFFIGSSKLLAPMHLLGSLCKILQKELPDNVTMTGYFPEGHVVRLIEGVLGITGNHEVMAKLDLGEL